MKVTLGVSSREDINKRVITASEGKAQGEFISFESPELLFKTLSAKRWDILKVMTGAGPVSIRKASRMLKRDVKAVHRDIHVLLDTGILQKTDEGQIIFPYDAIHVDFMVEAA